MSEDGHLLRLEHVAKRYPEGEADTPPILADVSLDVAAGQSLAVVGPSGCGKSTLLNIIGALDRPTEGRVLFDGEDLADLSEKQLARLRNRRVGFIFQEHHLLPQCTVIENVLVPTLVDGPASKEAQDRARRLLDRVGLAHRLTHRPGQLSGGERQRVAVVRAMINAPALLLADEPTGSLDRAAAENLAALLTELNEEENVALILVTHDLPLARRMATVYELRDGTLHADRAEG